jgi:hypothetical protein
MSKEDFNIEDDESCNHDEVCPCCIARENHINKFIEDLMEVTKGSGKLTFDSLIKVTNDFYSIVLKQGNKEALEDIIGYAAHVILGEEEDEDIQ